MLQCLALLLIQECGGFLCASERGCLGRDGKYLVKVSTFTKEGGARDLPEVLRND